MKRTGTLSVNAGISRLNTGTSNRRMARAGAGDPFAAATNFLANRGLDNGDLIWVTGTDGSIGAVPVIFIAEAGPATAIVAPAVAALLTGAGKASGGTKKRSTKRSARKGSSGKSGSGNSGKGASKKR